MLNNNEDSPAKGKVCSITINYPNFKDDFSAVIDTETPLLMKFCNTDFTLFKLDGEDTPYRDIANVFQYLIINKKATVLPKSE